jgi:hypothetical protein
MFRQSDRKVQSSAIALTEQMSLPGLTGQSSTPGLRLLDRPVKPGDDRTAPASVAPN